MIKWLHHLFNPHCEFCKENPIIDELRMELANARRSNQQMLNSILQQLNPTEPIKIEETEIRIPINPAAVPWRVRQQMLESEDRAKAELIRKKNVEDSESVKSTEQLEEELLGEDNGQG